MHRAREPEVMTGQNFWQRWTLRAVVSVPCLALAAVPMAQEYEYEPDEGLHREEWYDPSDWFDNDPGVDYESDWWDFNYGEYDAYDYDGFGFEPDVYEDSFYDENELAETYDFGNGDYEYYLDEAGADYGWHYDWNPVQDEWRSDYGYHTRTYNYDSENDYGWHWDWNPQDNRWVRDYGFHQSNYDYDYSKYDYSRQDRQNQARQQRAATQRESRQSRTAQQRPQQGEHQVQGQVESVKNINLRDRQGMRATHDLIRIRLQNGERAVVDIGESSLSRLNLDRGDRVQIRGVEGTISGRDVLMAELIRVNGQTHVIQRQYDRSGTNRRDREGQRNMTRRSGERDRGQATANRGGTQIRGQLEDFRKITLPNANQARTFIKLRLENGRSAVVDLGPNFSDQDLRQLRQRADRGDQIRVQGTRRQVDGRSVIRAQHLRVEGRDVLARSRS